MRTLSNNNLTSPNTPPSTTSGKLTINGSYTQSGTGNYTVELNGLTPQTQYDQIAPTGAVTLGGTLTISRTYLPAIGESFTIIDNTSPGRSRAPSSIRPRETSIQSTAFRCNCPTPAATATT